MYENLKKMSIKAKKKLKNANFFLEVCLMKLDKGIKLSIVFQTELSKAVQNHFGHDNVSQ